MSELLSCPFCGKSVAVIMDDYGECLERWGDEFDESGLEATDYKAVVCSFSDGGCGASGGWRKTEEEAVEAWNRRAHD